MKKPSPNPNGRPNKIKDAVRVNLTLPQAQKTHADSQLEGLNAYVRNLIERDMNKKETK